MIVAFDMKEPENVGMVEFLHNFFLAPLPNTRQIGRLAIRHEKFRFVYPFYSYFHPFPKAFVNDAERSFA